jgi:hypothetical protein
MSQFTKQNILDLAAENSRLKDSIKKSDEAIHDFLVHLNSSKFAGNERNWINTSDVILRLQELRNTLNFS